MNHNHMKRFIRHELLHEQASIFTLAIWSRRGVPGPGGCTWSWGCTWSRGVYLVPGVYLVLGGTWSRGAYLVPGGVPGLGGYLVQGVYLVWGWVHLVPGGVPGPGGCTWFGGGGHLVLGGYLVRYSHSPHGQTHACKHITLLQTSFAGGK